MNRFIRLAGLILLFGGGVQAINDNVGTSAGTFLKIGVGGRAEGMGGAYASLASDVTALFWNPAGLAHLSQPQAAFSHTQWIAEIRHTFLGLGWPIGNLGVVGLSVISLSMDELGETTETEPSGTGRTFPAGGIAIGAGYARKVSDRFGVGLQAKWVRETISFSRASALAFDLGTLYDTGFWGMRIGMAVTNFGPDLMMEGTDLIWKKTDPYPEIGSNPNVNSRLETKEWPLPVAARFGASLRPIGPDGIIKQDAVTVTVSADYYDPRDTRPSFNLGWEAAVMNILRLRGGLVNRFNGEFEWDEEDGVMALKKSDKFLDFYETVATFGAGIETTIPYTSTTLAVDYAYSSLPYFDQVSRLSIDLKF